MSEDADKGVPLAVDLDGTLLRVDSMEEALKFLWQRNPWKLIWYGIVKGFKSRAEFKWALYREVTLPELPLNEKLMEWLKGEKQKGRKLFLVSATPQFWVEKERSRLGDLFTEAIGSPQTKNLRGRRKARKLVEKFGAACFDYVGNSQADIPVWRVARLAYNVNKSAALKKEAYEAGVKLLQVAEVDQSEMMERWDGALRNFHKLFWLMLVLIFGLIMCGTKGKLCP